MSKLVSRSPFSSLYSSRMGATRGGLCECTSSAPHPSGRAVQHDCPSSLMSGAGKSHCSFIHMDLIRQSLGAIESYFLLLIFFLLCPGV